MRSSGFRRACVALVACSFVLTACGSSGDAADGKTRITVNCMPPKSAKVDRKFFEDDIAAFEKKNPDIDVVAHDAFPCQDPKTFDAKLAGGQMEDVFYTYFTDATHVVDVNQAADITSYVKDLKSYDTVQQQLRDIYTVDGKVYGVPRTGYSMGLIYNRGSSRRPDSTPTSPRRPGTRCAPPPRGSPHSAAAPSATRTTARRTRAAGTSPPSCTRRAATW
ncbi:hypothetical protein SAV31267_079340 [Streptomyces avermitilis]|uniref:Extracellular solute-binding protein n=1 Tax=Streptomyces avermitilis TaxID=33903 RepID=A0A4D4N4N1_STRAX|nr:hypothetical protein SAV31267_079340 [Streptomyces avermitilis]